MKMIWLKQPRTVFLLSVLLVVLLGIADYLTGWEFGFFVFYFIPVAYAAWYAGFRVSLVISLLSAVTWFFADALLEHTYSSPFFVVWNTSIRLCAFILIAQFIARTAQLLADEKKRLHQLQEAMDQIKVLRGFLPICAWCKKIRNDEGYWQQMESYIHEHSEADFTHGICEECAKNLSHTVHCDSDVGTING